MIGHSQDGGQKDFAMVRKKTRFGGFFVVRETLSGCENIERRREAAAVGESFFTSSQARSVATGVKRPLAAIT